MNNMAGSANKECCINLSMSGIGANIRYCRAQLKLLKEINFNNITKGLVRLHTIMTGNEYGSFKDEQEILQSKYRNHYVNFIKTQYSAAIKEIYRQLGDILQFKDTLIENNYVFSQIRVSEDISVLFDELTGIRQNDHSYTDSDLIDSAFIIIKNYVRKFRDVPNPDGKYIKDFNKRALSWLRGSQHSNNPQVVINTALIILMLMERHNTFFRNKISDNLDANFSSVVQFQNLTLTNEVIMCAGLTEFNSIKRCFESMTGVISTEGKKAILATLPLIFTDAIPF